MRNLKKVLALVLALVMSLSLVTIANASDFSDDADIKYDEAVDVMVAAGIIDGVGNNSFDPNGTLTREQAAKLITYMLLGENSEKLGVESSSFKDVAATRWSAPAIEYCATMGIIDGAGDGNFYPAGKLTGYAFAKMLLTALGYSSEREGYTGSNWTINVATKALSEDVRLDAGLENMFGNAELSRQEAAQMALNAVKAPLVEYDANNNVVVNGVEVQINGGGAKFVTTTLAKEQRINDRQLTNTGSNTQNSGYTVEFGERYLPKLECKRDVDAFGRPSYTWSYDRKEIGSYIDKDLLVAEYTTKVTGRELYDLLGRSVVEENRNRDEDYTFVISVDGEESKDVLNDRNLSIYNNEKKQYYFDRTGLNRDNTNQVGGTGNGVLTQVFQDTDRRIIYIAVINTYLAVAEDDYDAKKDEVSFEIWNVAHINSNKNFVKDDTNSTNVKVSGEDFNIKDFKSDDVVLVRVADNAIQEILTPEVIDNTEISAFKNDSYVVAAGKQYDYASAARYDDETLNSYSSTNMKDTTYRIFLDPYGYLIGIEEVDAETYYLFLTGIDGNLSNLRDKRADGNALFLDGTSKNITIDMKESDIKTGISSLMNTWCTYSVDEDGVYTLNEVAKTAADFDGKKVEGQSHMAKTYTSSDVASNVSSVTTADSEFVTIDKKHVSVNGIAGSTTVKKAYGNDKTVYLSAELDLITADKTLTATKAPAIIITDVDSVSTGVQSTDLNAFNAEAVVYLNSVYSDSSITNKASMPLTDVSHGVYSLFNDKGYVIAAVVVGEDNGSNTQFAWVNSDELSKESYSNKKWEYSRDVIIDGKLTTLTEIESAGNRKADIESIYSSIYDNRSLWWEVKTYSDGTVKSATRISGDGNGYEYVTDINDVHTTVKDTVILEQEFDGSNIYKVRGDANTLNMEPKNGTVRGLAVHPNANIVVVKDEQIYNGNTATSRYNYKEDIEYFTNNSDGDGLKRAVRYLNKADEFVGWVAAICEDGRATTLIIYDKTETEVDVGDGDTGSGDLRMTGISYNATSKKIVVNVEADTINKNAPYDTDYDTVIYHIADDEDILVVSGELNGVYQLTGDVNIIRGTVEIPYESTTAVGVYNVTITLSYRGAEVLSGKETRNSV